jgi:hypothetical protein
MARTDVAEIFNVLDDGTGAGAALSKTVVGDSPAAKNGVTAFAFKDSSGNVVLPQLLSDGRLPVSLDDISGTIKRARGEIQAGTLTATVLTGSTITLTASKKYSELSCIVSSRQDALFQLIWSDNGSETVLADLIVGSGQFTAQYTPSADQFTAGAVGTQQLYIKGNNFQKASALAGSLSCIET